MVTLPLLLLAILPSEPGGECPTPNLSVVSESPLAISLTVNGDGVNSDCVHVLGAGTDWVLDLTVSTTDAIHDQLDLTGTLRHVDPGAISLPISLHIDAGDLPGGTHVIPFAASMPHGGHTDELTGTVAVEVFFEEIFDFHFIFDYSVGISGLHVSSVPALPAGWVLLAGLGVALGGAFVLARRS